jgi:hypothetical protein
MGHGQTTKHVCDGAAFLESGDCWSLPSVIDLSQNISTGFAVIVASLAFGNGMAFADEVLAPSCRAEMTTAADQKSYLNDEQAARDMLVKQWSQFEPLDRARCRPTEEAGADPRHVELLTCLQIAASAKKEPNS